MAKRLTHSLAKKWVTRSGHDGKWECLNWKIKWVKFDCGFERRKWCVLIWVKYIDFRRKKNLQSFTKQAPSVTTTTDSKFPRYQIRLRYTYCQRPHFLYRLKMGSMSSHDTVYTYRKQKAAHRNGDFYVHVNELCFERLSEWSILNRE